MCNGCVQKEYPDRVSGGCTKCNELLAFLRGLLVLAAFLFSYKDCRAN